MEMQGSELAAEPKPHQNEHEHEVVEIVFKMLCPSDKFGTLKADGGRILTEETSAAVTIGPLTVEKERLITVAASENVGSEISPAQDAILNVFDKIAGNHKRIKSSLTARLVIEASQTHCLGDMILSLRNETGLLEISILGKPEIPTFLSHKERVVQIIGEYSTVEGALRGVTGKLRDEMFSATPSLSGISFSAVNVDRVREKMFLDRMREKMFLTKTTFEKPSTTASHSGISFSAVIVPQSLMAGVNVDRVREISEAKVIKHKPPTGSTDWIVLISGSPNQIAIAECIIKAFMYQGSSSG